ncbi:uncharacterized protein [Dendropsophus ebraccatus]|uniref:uncharacterized protein isoform X2 n=1 Tax=Dendropsophus ebraccatus TaxID=150705 RepID=UPI003831AB05
MVETCRRTPGERGQVMSQDPQCRNESKNPTDPGASSAASTSRVFSFYGDLGKISDCNTSKAKVKRRKTKKELNNAKYKSHPEIFKKRTFPRSALQRNNMGAKMVSQFGNSMQVFITENRLTQHQGIFNREIKSIDIGRLVNQEVDRSKTGTRQEVDTSKTGTRQEVDTSKTGTCQEVNTLKTGIRQEVDISKAGTHQEVETSKTDICQEVGTSKAGTLQELDTSKTGTRQVVDASETGTHQKVGTLRTGTSQEMDTMKTGTRQKVGTLKTGTSLEVDTWKTATCQKVGTLKTGTSHCTAESVKGTPQSQRSLSLGLIPTPESKNQDVNVSSPEMPVCISEHLPNNQQEKKSEKCQPCLQTKDHASLGSRTTSPCRNQPKPILETVNSIVNMLNKHSLFPGRNLISETRQAILEKMGRLRDRKSTPSSVASQKRPEHSQRGHVDIYKDQGWQCAAKGGTLIRKPVPRTQRAKCPIQTSPIRFLTHPRDSPAHTLIKMPSPEYDIKFNDILHQPSHHRPDPSYQYQHISSQSPHSLLNMNSSSYGSELIRQDRNASGFCRARRAKPMTSSTPNACSPPVRWRLADDMLTDPPYTHDRSSHNIRHISTSQATNQECLSRTPLEDTFLEAPNPPREQMRLQFSDDKTYSDAMWHSRYQRSPTTRILDVSPATIRLSHRAQSPRRIPTTRHFRSQPSDFQQGTHGSLGFSPLDPFRESRRETKRHVPSWLEADVGQHCGRFVTNTTPKQRHLLESRCHAWRHPPSILQEEPKHRMHGEDNGDMRLIPGNNWLQRRSHVEHNISVALSPRSVQQEPSFISYQYRKSTKKTSPRSSSTTWIYPRMKLY